MYIYVYSRIYDRYTRMQDQSTGVTLLTEHQPALNAPFRVTRSDAMKDGFSQERVSSEASCAHSRRITSPGTGQDRMKLRYLANPDQQGA